MRKQIMKEGYNQYWADNSVGAYGWDGYQRRLAAFSVFVYLYVCISICICVFVYLCLPNCTSIKEATSLSTTSKNIWVVYFVVVFVFVFVYVFALLHEATFLSTTSGEVLNVYLKLLTRYYPAKSLGVGPDAEIDEKALLEVKTFSSIHSPKIQYLPQVSCACQNGDCNTRCIRFSTSPILLHCETAPPALSSALLILLKRWPMHAVDAKIRPEDILIKSNKLIKEVTNAVHV